MSEQTVEEKFKKFIASDEPPNIFDFHRFSRLPNEPLSLLTAAPSTREVSHYILLTNHLGTYLLILAVLLVQFFTQLSKENKENVEVQLRALNEECQQQLKTNAESTDLATKKNENIAEFQRILNLHNLEIVIKDYFDDVAEKSINNIDHFRPLLKENYIDDWFYMKYFVTDLLKWFAKIFRKILKSMQEDHPLEREIIVKFLETFASLFRTPLVLIKRICCN